MRINEDYIEGFDDDMLVQSDDLVMDSVVECLKKVVDDTYDPMTDLSLKVIKKINLPDAIVKIPDNETLKRSIRLYKKYAGKGCSLNWMDVSGLKDFSGAFMKTDFNGDISRWDVSNAVSMDSMFTYSQFNKDISKWDVSNVRNMHQMFRFSYFNRDISKWDVSNVRNMGLMFCSSCFNKDISQWDVSNVTDMTSMFTNSDFKKNISGWNTQKVIDCDNMFWGNFCPDRFKPKELVDRKWWKII